MIKFWSMEHWLFSRTKTFIPIETSLRARGTRLAMLPISLFHCKFVPTTSITLLWFPTISSLLSHATNSILIARTDVRALMPAEEVLCQQTAVALAPPLLMWQTEFLQKCQLQLLLQVKKVPPKQSRLVAPKIPGLIKSWSEHGDNVERLMMRFEHVSWESLAWCVDHMHWNLLGHGRWYFSQKCWGHQTSPSQQICFAQKFGHHLLEWNKGKFLKFHQTGRHVTTMSWVFLSGSWQRACSASQFLVLHWLW